MKKFICLFFLCIMAISCENTVIEEEKTVTTRGTTSITPEQFASANSIFYNYKPIYGGTTGLNVIKLSGDINTFKEGVEYDFIFWCETKGNAKCVVWADGADLSCNGKYYGSIYGEYGKQLKITAKFRNRTTRFTLEIVGELYSGFHEAKARFVIDGTRYNGEYVGAPGYFIKHESAHDLTVDARFMNLTTSPIDGHWVCQNCHTTNALYNTNCIGCGK